MHFIDISKLMTAICEGFQFQSRCKKCPLLLRVANHCWHCKNGTGQFLKQTNCVEMAFPQLQLKCQRRKRTENSNFYEKSGSFVQKQATFCRFSRKSFGTENGLESQPDFIFREFRKMGTFKKSVHFSYFQQSHEFFAMM